MRIEKQPDMSALSTLRLGGRGRVIYYPETAADLEEIFAAEAGTARLMCLGRGSNILFAGGEKDIGFIRWTGNRICFDRESGLEEVFIYAQAGAGLPDLIRWGCARGLSGLEPLVGIPASIGGALAMNAGSHGRQISELVAKIRIWSPGRGERDIPPSAMRAQYRELRFAGEVFPVITGVCLRLTRSSPGAVWKKVRYWYLRKKSKQPLLERTAGCVFKNPPGLSSGRILDRLGFKGAGKGGVCFSDRHANFLVHTKSGSAPAALELIETARQAMRDKAGIDPELEVKIIK